mmetsp:Transcript_29077/g.48817  ORF Transcript_29077/g.48817 Transcript_29077/m.48817 type:complete len:230 (+) Transcript_29077:251-940(+)
MGLFFFCFFLFCLMPSANDQQVCILHHRARLQRHIPQLQVLVHLAVLSPQVFDGCHRGPVQQAHIGHVHHHRACAFGCGVFGGVEEGGELVGGPEEQRAVQGVLHRAVAVHLAGTREARLHCPGESERGDDDSDEDAGSKVLVQRHQRHRGHGDGVSQRHLVYILPGAEAEGLQAHAPQHRHQRNHRNLADVLAEEEHRRKHCCGTAQPGEPPLTARHGVEVGRHNHCA